MIKLFRHIRQRLLRENRFSKPASPVGRYLLYAIGEIILVVIGILIALEINNWNEARKENAREKLVITNLIQDLKSDSISYMRNSRTAHDINTLHQKLYKIGVKGDKDTFIEKPHYIRRLLWYNPITKENDPFVANKISNNQIRKEIQVYFRYTKDMDDIYGEFEDVIKDRMRIYLAEQNIHNLSAWFENQSLESVNIIRREQLIELSKQPEFQQLLFEASGKCSEVMDALEALLAQNIKLISLLEAELNH